MLKNLGGLRRHTVSGRPPPDILSGRLDLRQVVVVEASPPREDTVPEVPGSGEDTLTDRSSTKYLVEPNLVLRLDTSGAEELSVKTLADMYDYRLGEQVAKVVLL